jgi:hypothetical protein
LPPARAGAAAIDAKLANVGVLNHKNSYSKFDVVEEIAGDSLRRFGYI